MGFRSSLCIFSTSASSIVLRLSAFLTIAGISATPNCFDALQRLSPAIILYPLLVGRTIMGCSIPCSCIELIKDSIWVCANCLRGCASFGWISARFESALLFRQLRCQLLLQVKIPSRVQVFPYLPFLSLFFGFMLKMVFVQYRQRLFSSRLCYEVQEKY